MYKNLTHRGNASFVKRSSNIIAHFKHLNTYKTVHIPSINDIKSRFSKIVLIFFLCIILFAVICPVTATAVFLLIEIIIITTKLIIIAGTAFLANPNEKQILKNAMHIKAFPLYTIVVPLFMERRRNIISLRKNLLNIKYPNIEILYLIEDIDSIAIHTFKSFTLEPFEKYIVIPRIPPFTKPKACNYALEFARGKYLVIYDAEDKPHPYQLHVAHYIFSQKKNISCIQFPLEFSQEKTIQERWQKIDYTLWYNCLVRLLSKINAPIPLGGTSNHFLVKDLRMAGGWDSYNVTEDAEIGVRMSSLGYNVHYCSMFATVEKPLQNLVNLFYQRVRWSKGHLMTAIQTTPQLIKSRGIVALPTLFILASQWILLPIAILLFIMGYSSPIIYGNKFLMALVCINIVIFLIMPLLYFVIIKECRSSKMLIPLLTYNVFHIFYVAVLVKALHETISAPFKWYKTIR